MPTLFSVNISMNLSTPCSSYQWDYTVFAFFFFLNSWASKMSSSFIYSLVHDEIYFWYQRIPHCINTLFVDLLLCSWAFGLFSVFWLLSMLIRMLVYRADVLFEALLSITAVCTQEWVSRLLDLVIIMSGTFCGLTKLLTYLFYYYYLVLWTLEMQ